MQFYKQHPFDDRHRFYRPAAVIAQSMRGGDLKPILEFLEPEAIPEGMTEADMNTLKAFGVKR